MKFWPWELWHSHSSLSLVRVKCVTHLLCWCLQNASWSQDDNWKDWSIQVNMVNYTFSFWTIILLTHTCHTCYVAPNVCRRWQCHRSAAGMPPRDVCKWGRQLIVKGIAEKCDHSISLRWGSCQILVGMPYSWYLYRNEICVNMVKALQYHPEYLVLSLCWLCWYEVVSYSSILFHMVNNRILSPGTKGIGYYKSLQENIYLVDSSMVHRPLTQLPFRGTCGMLTVMMYGESKTQDQWDDLPSSCIWRPAFSLYNAHIIYHVFNMFKVFQDLIPQVYLPVSPS